MHRCDCVAFNNEWQSLLGPKARERRRLRRATFLIIQSILRRRGAVFASRIRLLRRHGTARAQLCLAYSAPMTVGQSTERFIFVLGQECRLTVAHVSKSVWIAGGQFAGQHRTSRAGSLGGAMLAFKRDVERDHKPSAMPLIIRKIRQRHVEPRTAYPLAPATEAVQPGKLNGPTTRTLRFLARRRRAW